MLGKALSTAAAGNAAGEVAYVEDVFSTYLYDGKDSTNYDVTNGIALGSNEVQSLKNKTVTNLGTVPSSTYPLENLSNGRREVSNGQDITYWASAGADFYVDLGEAKAVNAYLVAPQGNPPSTAYNVLQNFDVRASNDGSSWTDNLASFTSITTGDWSPGTFREFSFSNTTEYRYWRFTQSDANALSISELAFKYADTLPEAKGGLVWIKQRDAVQAHLLFDTERGATKFVQSDASDQEITDIDTLISFNSNGFSLGQDPKSNDTGNTFASWTFAKQEKFFDVVTYTGNGTNQAISHNLGSVPGAILVKKLNGATDWIMYHRGVDSSIPEDYGMRFNLTDARDNDVFWNDTPPTSTEFTVGNKNATNQSGGSYVAYLFAHNDGDGIFGENGDQDIIKCGSYYGSNQTIDLGFEPQFIIVKNTNLSENWMMFDNMRGWNADGNSLGWLMPNAYNAESTLTNGQFELRSNGFFTGSGYSPLNGNSTYIYIAIRRGPMKTPESGTEVFDVVTYSGDGSANRKINTDFPVDLNITKGRTPTGRSPCWGPRVLRGMHESSNTGVTYDSLVGWMDFDYPDGYLLPTAYTFSNNSSSTYVSYNFRRAPGFFDVVAYEGNGTSGHSIDHNLGVTPEMVIIKNRDATSYWQVHFPNLGVERLQLNTTQAELTDGYTLSADATTFTPTGNAATHSYWNASANSYIAYLFATLPGVSKVGSYTGNASGTGTQTIDCGFSNGARFVLIKCTSGTGNWVLFDSERGITAGLDNFLYLNATDAETTNADLDVDSTSSGFILDGDHTSINRLGREYIFYALA